jgi:hypothetical protein
MFCFEIFSAAILSPKYNDIFINGKSTSQYICELISAHFTLPVGIK